LLLLSLEQQLLSVVGDFSPLPEAMKRGRALLDRSALPWLFLMFGSGASISLDLWGTGLSVFLPQI
jgi:hypothetical protein